MKLTPKVIEELAVEIRRFLIEKEIWIDTKIYFNNKAFSTDDDTGSYYNDSNHLVVLEDIEPSDYITYLANPHILSMTFEGPLCGTFNLYEECSSELKMTFIDEFSAILSRYGLYYEMGEHWNLSCYLTEPDKASPPRKKGKAEPIWFCGDMTRPAGAVIPDKLLEIQRYWYIKAKEYGDVGSCVLGAGFEYEYKGVRYSMPPIPAYQGSISWEHCKDEIEAMLMAAGATDIVYHWGRMD